MNLYPHQRLGVSRCAFAVMLIESVVRPMWKVYPLLTIRALSHLTLHHLQAAGFGDLPTLDEAKLIIDLHNGEPRPPSCVPRAWLRWGRPMTHISCAAVSQVVA